MQASLNLLSVRKNLSHLIADLYGAAMWMIASSCV